MIHAGLALKYPIYSILFPFLQDLLRELNDPWEFSHPMHACSHLALDGSWEATYMHIPLVHMRRSPDHPWICMHHVMFP